MQLQAIASPLVRRIHVEGFKSLLDVEVDLGTINVFIGANGSGKSSLLEAIGVLGATSFGSVDAEALGTRGVRWAPPAMYKTSLSAYRFRRLISIAAASDTANYRVGLDNLISAPSARWRVTTETLMDGSQTLLSRSPRGANFYSDTGVPIHTEFSPEQSLARLANSLRPDAEYAKSLLDRLEQFAIFAPTSPGLRVYRYGNVGRQPMGLDGGGLGTAVHELFDGEGPRTFDQEDVVELIDWAESFSTVEMSGGATKQREEHLLVFRDRYMRRERRIVSALDASEGALFVLFLLVLSAHPASPSLVAVDNFDHALHPRLMAKLMKLASTELLARADRQLLLTTHNPLALDGLDLTNDQVRLFAVDREADGATKVRRIVLSPEALAEAGRLPISRLWVMGRLGGVPRDV